MIALAGLIYLPRVALAALALAMIAGHNLLDGIRAEQLQGFAFPVAAPARTRISEARARHKSPCALSARPVDRRDGRRLRVWSGDEFSRTATTALARWARAFSWWESFVVLRALNVYGDPAPWQASQLVERERPLVHQLRKVSAVAALSGDDARSRAHRRWRSLRMRAADWRIG